MMTLKPSMSGMQAGDKTGLLMHIAELMGAACVTHLSPGAADAARRDTALRQLTGR